MNRITNTQHRLSDKSLSKLPIVRLSSAEKAEHSRRGFYWYCDERWAPGYVCKHKFLAFMGEDDELDEEQPEQQPDDTTTLITADVLSVLSPSGTPNARALHITGSIGQTPVQVLIDTGATHNFIHPQLEEKPSLTLQLINPFRVYVGNGVPLICSNICSNMCPGTALLLQGNLFEVDIHVLAVHEPDIILGMKWLQTLRRVTHDYIDMTMDFILGDRTIQLRVDTPSPRMMSFKQLGYVVVI